MTTDRLASFDIHERCFSQAALVAVTGVDPVDLQNWLKRPTTRAALAQSLPVLADPAPKHAKRMYCFLDMVGIAAIVQAITRFRMLPADAAKLAKRMIEVAIKDSEFPPSDTSEATLIGCYFDEKGKLQVYDSGQPRFWKAIGAAMHGEDVVTASKPDPVEDMKLHWRWQFLIPASVFVNELRRKLLKHMAVSK